MGKLTQVATIYLIVVNSVQLSQRRALAFVFIIEESKEG